MTATTEIATAAATLGRKGGTAKTEAKTAAARANGISGGRPRRPMFEVEVYANAEGGNVRFASVRHLASGCGADFYETGEREEWQDNNGLFSNCSDYIVKLASNAAAKALA